MTYAQIDDHFDDSPKFVDYDAAVMGLLACGITYANRHLTNGVIPRGWPKRRFPRDGEKALATLLKDGRWVLREDGNLEIVGFLDHNLSRDEVIEKRAAKTEVKTEAGRLGGIKSGEVRRRKREAESKQTSRSTEAPAIKQAKQNEALSSPLLSSPTERSPLPPEEGFPSRTDPVSAVQLRTAPAADPDGDYDIGQSWADATRIGSGIPMPAPRGGALKHLLATLEAHGPPRSGPAGVRSVIAYARETGERYGAAARHKRNVFDYADWMSVGNGAVDDEPSPVADDSDLPPIQTEEARLATISAAKAAGYL